MGPFVWNSNQNTPQLPAYSLYIKGGIATPNLDMTGYDMRKWAKELLDYLHVNTWDASCQGEFNPCAWINLPAECGTTPLDIFNTGGGGVQIRTENCTWLFSDGCELYLPGGITFPDGSSIMSAPKALSITDGIHTVTGVTGINFNGAVVSGTSPNGIVTISSAGVTLVRMTVPSAFSVSPSAITSSGTFAITANGNSSQYINGAGALATFPTFPTSIPVVSGGTGISGYTLGDTLYGNISGTLSTLSGNTTTANKFLSQTGTGSVSAAPVWFDLFGTANTWSARQTFSASNGVLFTYTLASLMTHLQSYINTTSNGNGTQWLSTNSAGTVYYSAVRQLLQGTGAGSGVIAFTVNNAGGGGGTALTPHFSIDGWRGFNASFVPLQIMSSAGTNGVISSTTAAASLDVIGSFATNITAITSSTVLGNLDSTVLCSAATGTINITLPQVSGRERRIYTIKKIDSSGNAINITANFGDTVEGSSSYSISTLNTAITIQCYGNNWYIIGKV